MGPQFELDEPGLVLVLVPAWAAPARGCRAALKRVQNPWGAHGAAAGSARSYLSMVFGSVNGLSFHHLFPLDPAR